MSLVSINYTFWIMNHISDVWKKLQKASYMSKAQNERKGSKTLIKYYSNKMISLSKIMSDLHISAAKSTIPGVIKADPNIINKKIKRKPRLTKKHKDARLD